MVVLSFRNLTMMFLDFVCRGLQDFHIDNVIATVKPLLPRFNQAIQVMLVKQPRAVTVTSDVADFAQTALECGASKDSCLSKKQHHSSSTVSVERVNGCLAEAVSVFLTLVADGQALPCMPGRSAAASQLARHPAHVFKALT